MGSVFLATAIVGLVELIKAINVSNWETAELIVGAALIGLLCGVFRVDNLTVVTGIQAGLVAAGSYRIGSLIGGK